MATHTLDTRYPIPAASHRRQTASGASSPRHLTVLTRSEPCPPAARHHGPALLHGLTTRHHTARPLFRYPPQCAAGYSIGKQPPGISPLNTRPTAIRRRTEKPTAHPRRQTAAAAPLPRHTPTHASARNAHPTRNAHPPRNAHPTRDTHPPRNTHPSGTRIRPGTRIPADPHCRSAPSTHTRTKKAKHPCGCFASLWKRGVRYSPRAKRL